MHINANHDVVAKLVAGGDGSLAHLSDTELLASTRGLVGKSNQLFAALLAHLAEVEARGLHRTRACASLYTYCIYELRFSEDAAARRAGAAKLVKRFPLLLSAIANGELHLTGLLMLGPHLTRENVLEVLGRAKFRTKKELAKLVRELHPLPLVPDAIEPLCPDRGPLRSPTWQEFVASFAPAVRELPPGERPRDWANDVDDGGDADNADCQHGADDPDVLGGSALGENVLGGNVRDALDQAPAPPAPARVEPHETGFAAPAPRSPAPARVEAPRREPPVAGPQQYQVQFSTTEEHVRLIERAKALLAREAPSKSLGELHLQAMKLLVAALEKQKFAVTERPRQKLRRAAAMTKAQAARDTDTDTDTDTSWRRRHIPASVRRAVFGRDGARCSFVDERGERCSETHRLELHHRRPFGKGGEHKVENLTLHCPAHNALAAELDFGRQHVAERREPHRHESRASLTREQTR